jgi:hypothetical protein
MLVDANPKVGASTRCWPGLGRPDLALQGQAELRRTAGCATPRRSVCVLSGKMAGARPTVATESALDAADLVVVGRCAVVCGRTGDRVAVGCDQFPTRAWWRGVALRADCEVLSSLRVLQTELTGAGILEPLLCADGTTDVVVTAPDPV